jgi:uncharacterized protein
MEGAGDRRASPRGIIGMIHLLPLPGAPRWGGSMDAVVRRALADADALSRGPVDAILVENFGDSPFHPGPVPPETVAALSAAVAAVRGATSLPVGVNVLRNDAAAALAIAAATGASFIRVNVHTGGMYTDQGWIQGDAAATLRSRQRLAPGVAILADVLVKHAAPPPGLDLARAARDAWERGHADALVVSGAGTAEPTDLEDVRTVRTLLPGAPTLVGSGVTEATLAAALATADGVIIGAALQAEGRPGNAVDGERVRRMVAAGRGTAKGG